MPVTNDRRTRSPRRPIAVIARTMAMVVTAIAIGLTGCAGADDPAPTATPAPVDLANRIPTPAELPLEFLTQAVEQLTLIAYAATWPNSESAFTQLHEWGFDRAVRRVSWRNPAVPTPEDGTISQLTTIGVEYGSHNAAVAASEANRLALMAAEGYTLSPAEPSPIGDVTLAATGTILLNGRTFDVAHVWVINDAIVISYGAVAMDYDPLADVLDIAAAANTRS